MNWRVLALLCLLALVLRIAAAVNTKVINHDGARFTMSARAMVAGDVDYALNVEPRMPPLYPLLIVQVSHLAGDLGLAGVIISVLCGTLLVIPIYLLARAMFGDRVAWLAGLVVAILPELVLVSGDVWTEPLFLLCFFSSIAAIWFAGERDKLWLYALAGFFGGLAVNTRPEGLYTLAAILGWGAIVAWIRRGEPRAAERIAGPLVASAIWILCLLPYSNWIHERFGFWSPTANQFALEMLGKRNVERSYTEGYRVDESTHFESGRDQRSLGRVFGTLWYVFKIYLRTSGYVFLPLLVAGFFFLRRSRGTVFVILVALGYALPTWVGVIVGLPFDDRFALAPLVALAPVIAIGMLRLRERLPEAWPRSRIAAVAMILLVIGCAVKPFRPRDHRRLTLKEAGLWIKKRYGPGSKILTMDRRVEHYAEAWSERVPPGMDHTIQLVHAMEAVAIVIYNPYMDRHDPGFEEWLASRFPMALRIPRSDRGHEVRIYVNEFRQLRSR